MNPCFEATSSVLSTRRASRARVAGAHRGGCTPLPPRIYAPCLLPVYLLLIHMAVSRDAIEPSWTPTEYSDETRETRCPDCNAPAEHPGIKQDWCIACAQPVHSHPTDKDREERTRLENRFWEKIDTREPDQCWPWTRSSQRYGRFWLADGKALAHRVAYALHHDLDIESIEDINHRCHNTLCCNPRHLKVGNQSENLIEACTEGDRDTRFTDDEIREIKRLYNGPDTTQKDIADRFGVSVALISGILRGQYYSWVDE